MATTGTTIESPRIGQTITFIRTGADTAGAELVIEGRMCPGAFMPPHVHLLQAEHFEVLDGIGTFRVAGKKILAGPGEHGGRSRGRSPFSQCFCNRCSHPRDAATSPAHGGAFRAPVPPRRGRPRQSARSASPWRTAALIREFREEFFYLAGVPVALQRLLAGTRP